MATLQAGQTVSIQLAEGESYTVTPSGTAQVSTRGVSGSELSAPRTLTSAQTFGPYTEAGAISIACLSGTVDYTQAGGPVYQSTTTGALVGGPFGARELILNAASSGAATAWLPISPNPERLIYQLTTGSVSTGFAVDISADGVSSLGQAFTGTWASSTTAYITGLISYSNPLARYFRVTVTSGGPISMARGA